MASIRSQRARARAHARRGLQTESCVRKSSTANISTDFCVVAPSTFPSRRSGESASASRHRIAHAPARQRRPLPARPRCCSLRSRSTRGAGGSPAVPSNGSSVSRVHYSTVRQLLISPSDRTVTVNSTECSLRVRNRAEAGAMRAPAPRVTRGGRGAQRGVPGLLPTAHVTSTAIGSGAVFLSVRTRRRGEGAGLSSEVMPRRSGTRRWEPCG